MSVEQVLPIRFMPGDAVRRLVVSAFGGALMALGCTSETPRSAPQVAIGVAQVFGDEIGLDDLEVPSERKIALRREFSESSEEQLILKWRAERLAEIIWSALLEDLGRSHSLEATESEIRSALNALKTLAASADESSMGPASYQAFVAGVVKEWKVSKVLYEEFGGDVVFHEKNPMDAVGAKRMFLAKHERHGSFTIRDVELASEFWEYYRREHPDRILSKIDFSRPWWENLRH
jgi:hypothetical protein